MSVSPQVPDATALAAFALCPESYRSRHLLHLVKERAGDDAASAGQAWHAAMKSWFGSDSSLGAATAALAEAWGPEPLFVAAPVKRPRALYQRLLEVYAEKWPRASDPFTVERNEEWCEGTINVGKSPEADFIYGGIVDRLIHMDGAHYVMDTKTTSGYLTDSYFAQYALSPQLIGYVALELALGRECEGAYIDAVHIDTRGGKAEPKHLVRHGPIRYRQDQVSEWARATEWRLRQIDELTEQRGSVARWPQNPHSCFKWNRACPFWERCQLPEELARDLPGYVGEPWEPHKRGEGT